MCVFDKVVAADSSYVVCLMAAVRWGLHVVKVYVCVSVCVFLYVCVCVCAYLCVRVCTYVCDTYC